jgi:hypothetical protein
MGYTRSNVIAIAVSGLLTVAGGVTSAKPYKEWSVWFFGLGALALLAKPFVRGRTESNRATSVRIRTAPRKEKVEFDGDSIRRYMADGRSESIRWSEIREIAIVTTADGPWSDDVFWLFLSADQKKGCLVSNNADGFKLLLPRLQTLPGFDNRAVVAAMGSATENKFLVWRTAAQQAISADRTEGPGSD